MLERMGGAEPAPGGPAKGPRPLRICLAASGGGHLRQLLDLESVWSKHDHFFVTEKISLGESIAREHRVHFVEHYSLGQMRWGKPVRMGLGMARNLVQSLRIIARERPDVVITTGAGAVYWVSVLARLLRRPLVFIESFARFDHPSQFGKMVKPIATDLIVQSPALKLQWPDAQVFDPLKPLDKERPRKRQLLFATVGATLPFDRMTGAVLDFMNREGASLEAIIQTGQGSRYAGQSGSNWRCVESLPFDEVKEILKEAELVITHGGTGSLITALREGCRVVAMPRSFDRKEHYDDHQLEIVNSFGGRGLIQVATDVEDLPAAIERARSAPPQMFTTDHSRLAHWLEERLAALATHA